MKEISVEAEQLNKYIKMNRPIRVCSFLCETKNLNWRFKNRQLGEEKPEEELMGKVFNLTFSIIPWNNKNIHVCLFFLKVKI